MVPALRIITIGLVVLSLGVAPVVMAAPAQQNEMKACNEQANAKEFGE